MHRLVVILLLLTADEQATAMDGDGRPTEQRAGNHQRAFADPIGELRAFKQSKRFRARGEQDDALERCVRVCGNCAYGELERQGVTEKGHLVLTLMTGFASVGDIVVVVAEKKGASVIAKRMEMSRKTHRVALHADTVDALRRCFFRGTVQGDANSVVKLNLCGEIVGQVEMGSGKSYSFESFQYSDNTDGIVTCDGTTRKQLDDGEVGLRPASSRSLIMPGFANNLETLSYCEPFGDDALRPTVLELALTVDQTFLDRTNGSWARALAAIDFATEVFARELCVRLVVRAFFVADDFTSTSTRALHLEHCQWLTRGWPRHQYHDYDLAHFITGVERQTNFVGEAELGGVCSRSKRCGISHLYATQAMLNELVVHDSNTCGSDIGCCDQYCLANEVISGIARRFSACSKRQFQAKMIQLDARRRGRSNCLRTSTLDTPLESTCRPLLKPKHCCMTDRCIGPRITSESVLQEGPGITLLLQTTTGTATADDCDICNIAALVEYNPLGADRSFFKWTGPSERLNNRAKDDFRLGATDQFTIRLGAPANSIGRIALRNTANDDWFVERAALSFALRVGEPERIEFECQVRLQGGVDLLAGWKICQVTDFARRACSDSTLMASSAVRIRQVPTGIWAMRLDAAGGAQLEMSSECSVEQCGLLLIYVDSGFQLRHMDTGMLIGSAQDVPEHEAPLLLLPDAQASEPRTSFTYDALARQIIHSSGKRVHVAGRRAASGTQIILVDGPGDYYEFVDTTGQYCLTDERQDVLIAGGFNGRDYSNITLNYHTAGNRFSTLTDMTDRIAFLDAAFLDGLVYTTGGQTGPDFSSRLSTAATLDVRTGIWSSIAPMMRTRSFHALVALRGLLYAIGGADENNYVHSTVERYDPLTFAWTLVEPLPEFRSGIAAASMGDCIYAVGGWNTTDYVATCFRYCTANGRWTSIAPMSTARFNHAVAAQDGVLYVCGGYSANGVRLSSCESYDTTTDMWSDMESLPSAREQFTMAAVNGKIYAFGGFARTQLAEVLRYDPRADTWTRLDDMPIAVNGMAAVAIPSIY